MTSQTKITVLGTGAIGSAVMTTLREAGHDVVGWDRRSSLTATAAVGSSDLVLLTVTDYAAVDDVLDQLGGALAGRTVVVLTTGTPADAQRVSARLAGLGAVHLDAGVQTAPEDVGSDRASFLYSGPREAFDRHQAVLELLGGPRYVGAQPDAAATWDLLLFGIWYDAQLGLLRALAAGQQAGVDLEDLAKSAAMQLGHVVDAATATATEMRDGTYPRGPADLREHLAVVEQLERLRSANPLGTGGLGDVRRGLERAIAAGHGERGLTALAGVTAGY